MAIGEVGALTGLALNPEEETEEEDGLFRFNVYQNLTGPEPDFKLQDVYGTAAMPMYEWVRRVKTGERTFDPANQFDNSMLDQYKQNLAQTGQQETNPTMMDLVKGLVPSIGGMVGESIGRAVVNPAFAGQDFSTKAMAGVKSLAPNTALPSAVNRSGIDSFIDSGLSDQTGFLKDAVYSPNLDNKISQLDTPKLLDLINKKAVSEINVGSKAQPRIGYAVNDRAVLDQELGELASPEDYASANVVNQGEGSFGQSFDEFFSKDTAAGAAGSFGFSFGLDLIMGKDPVEAAKSAAGAAVGGAIGSTFGPIGGFIGAAVGKLVTGGRVICNELNRQGLMSKRQVVLDYRFTRDYLSPKHVNGYHVWAVFVVKQMRKGKFVNFWKHIATHRANEIAYIYGERDKPDYLGKIYRHIGEPICWVLGVFSDSSDWSTLYNSKEI